MKDVSNYLYWYKIDRLPGTLAQAYPKSYAKIAVIAMLPVDITSIWEVTKDQLGNLE